MPKKYQKPKNKNSRYTHNRPYHGCWWDYGKEYRKAARKRMKALRHKLLFHIPLTDEEKEMVAITRLTAESAIDHEGHVCSENEYVTDENGKRKWVRKPYSGKTERWRFMNPKEMREKYGKPQKELDKKK